jgi:hypothetical protein
MLVSRFVALGKPERGWFQEQTRVDVPSRIEVGYLTAAWTDHQGAIGKSVRAQVDGLLTSC